MRSAFLCAMTFSLAACHGKRADEPVLTAQCHLPVPYTTVWTCGFENGDDCGFFPATNWDTDDPEITVVRHPGESREGSSFLSVRTENVSANPHRSGVCVLLDPYTCPGGRYSLIAFRKREGATGAENPLYSFGIDTGEPNEILEGTTIFWNVPQDFPERRWLEFDVRGFTADMSQYLCVGTGSLQQMWFDGIYMYAVPGGDA